MRPPPSTTVRYLQREWQEVDRRMFRGKRQARHTGADGDMLPGGFIEVEASGIGALRNYVVPAE